MKSYKTHSVYGHYFVGIKGMVSKEGYLGRSRLFEAQETVVSDSDVENFLLAIVVLHHMRP
jgi:hypothetical protein